MVEQILVQNTMIIQCDLLVTVVNPVIEQVDPISHVSCCH